MQAKRINLDKHGEHYEPRGASVGKAEYLGPTVDVGVSVTLSFEGNSFSARVEKVNANGEFVGRVGNVGDEVPVSRGEHILFGEENVFGIH